MDILVLVADLFQPEVVTQVIKMIMFVEALSIKSLNHDQLG